MKTRQLYYENSHLDNFTATVLSCRQTDRGTFAVVLDATAFYPEGGGQAGDTGILLCDGQQIRVLDTREQDGTVVHFCEKPLTPGQTVDATLDYGPRFLRMQQHSGEHIVSGILNRRYGCHNVGFHMGSEIVTIDFDAVIPAEVLPEIEAEANRAVWANLPIRCWCPSPEELAAIPYRSKRALPWPVRIVEIPGYDLCACCGTHVLATGEIGLIKLFSAVGFRGGTRMEMACGSAALAVLNRAYEQNKLVSQAFSAQMEETGAAARRMNEMLAQQKYRTVGLEKRIFTSLAREYQNSGDVVHFEPGLDSTGVRTLADAIAEDCGGLAAVFSGEDTTGYAYCLVSRQGDLRSLGKDMTKALHGRGGGKPQFQQGSVHATRVEIEGFFREKGEKAELFR